VLPQDVSTIGQPQAPGEGSQEGVYKEFDEGHPGDARRQADEGAYHRQQPGGEDGEAPVLIEPAVGSIQVMVRDKQISPVSFQEGASLPHAHPVGQGGAQGASQGPVSSR